MRKGSKMSAESRARLSESMRGHSVSQETRAKIGDKNRGHAVTEEMRQHLSEKLKGRPRNLTEESRASMVTKLRARTRSQETIAKWRASRAGYRHSEETKAKLRANAFIRVFTDERKKEYSDRMKGNQNGLGYHHTEEAKIKIGKASIGRSFPSQVRRGPANNKWKGGITAKNYSLRTNIDRLIEYKTWRKAVFERDDYTCQICHKRGGKLRAHHITHFVDIVSKYRIETVEQALQCKELWDINNGITYCCGCHWEKHFGDSVNENEKIIPITRIA